MRKGGPFIYGLIAIIAALMVAVCSTQALAYIGPGAGVSLFGAAIGVATAIFTALAIILLWPIRMLIRLVRKTPAKAAMTAPAEAARPSESA